MSVSVGPTRQDSAQELTNSDTAHTSVTDGELRCPECGLTASESTLDSRPGDICPDCRKGYLEAE
jgi:uncharacterized paraquat-inducible protein A